MCWWSQAALVMLLWERAAESCLCDFFLLSEWGSFKIVWNRLVLHIQRSARHCTHPASLLWETWNLWELQWTSQCQHKEWDGTELEGMMLKSCGYWWQLSFTLADLNGGLDGVAVIIRRKLVWKLFDSLCTKNRERDHGTFVVRFFWLGGGEQWSLKCYPCRLYISE